MQVINTAVEKTLSQINLLEGLKKFRSSLHAIYYTTLYTRVCKIEGTHLQRRPQWFFVTANLLEPDSVCPY